MVGGGGCLPSQSSTTFKVRADPHLKLKASTSRRRKSSSKRASFYRDENAENDQRHAQRIINMNRDLIVGGEAIPAAADEEKKAKQTENSRRM